MKRLFWGLFVGLSLCSKYAGEVAWTVSKADCHASLLKDFGYLNCLFIALYFTLRAIRQLIFGTLTAHEIISISEKFNYTLYEFLFGMAVLKFKDNATLNCIIKPASLCVCLLLLKCFHHLCDLKVQRINNQTSIAKLVASLTLIFLIDTLLVLKFKNDFDQDPILKIFGYELLNLYPFILTTVLNLASYYSESALRFKVVIEFGIHLLRFSCFLIYLWFFNSYYTFPIHILPSSYNCFRLLLNKTRTLIKLQRNSIYFQAYDRLLVKATDSDNIDSVCCFCLQDQCSDQDVRILTCKHAFHYSCLKLWLVSAKTCPVCRAPVSFCCNEQQHH